MPPFRKKEAASAADASPPEMAANAETAEYIEDMVHQLERLAASSNLARLAELLAQAREEARRAAFG
jgi:hypothetical protein